MSLRAALDKVKSLLNSRKKAISVHVKDREVRIVG